MGSGCFELDRNIITHFPRIRILVPGYLPGEAKEQHIQGRLVRRPAIPAPESALRSHPCVAVPSAQVRSGYTRLASLHKKSLQKRHPRAITTLVLGRLSLAGFEVITYGRFSGDYRG